MSDVPKSCSNCANEVPMPNTAHQFRCGACRGVNGEPLPQHLARSEWMACGSDAKLWQPK